MIELTLKEEEDESLEFFSQQAYFGDWTIYETKDICDRCRSEEEKPGLHISTNGEYCCSVCFDCLALIGVRKG